MEKDLFAHLFRCGLEMTIAEQVANREQDGFDTDFTIILNVPKFGIETTQFANLA